MKISFATVCALVAMPLAACAGQEAITSNSPHSSLSDATILLIRHAEKPESGQELSPAGVERSKAYVRYFQHLTLDSKPVHIDALFATADSKGSHRPRLTLEPLAQSTGLKINAQFKNKDFPSLAAELFSKDHGKCILICWHHGSIPELIESLGANPNQILPGGKWPDNQFDWLVELRYDHEGRLIPGESKRIEENLVAQKAD